MATTKTISDALPLGTTPQDGDFLLVSDASETSTKTKKMTVAQLSAAFTNSSSIILPNIPTSDPNVNGQVWSDNGVLKVSS